MRWVGRPFDHSAHIISWEKMAPSPTAAAAASAAGGGGRVCAVITITATANANGESVPHSRTHSLTPGPLCVTPRFQFRLLHFQILPISRLNEGILTQPYGSIICCICSSTARNTRRCPEWKCDVCWPDKERRPLSPSPSASTAPAPVCPSDLNIRKQCSC